MVAKGWIYRSGFPPVRQSWKHNSTSDRRASRKRSQVLRGGRDVSSACFCRTRRRNSEGKLISFNSERKGEFPRVCRVEIASIEQLPQGTDADVRGVCEWVLTRAARILAVGAGGEGAVSVRSARSPLKLYLYRYLHDARRAVWNASNALVEGEDRVRTCAPRISAKNIAFLCGLVSCGGSNALVSVPAS